MADSRPCNFSPAASRGGRPSSVNGLLGLPLCTALELVEPALPGLPYQCADDVVGLALASSPEIRSAQETIHKAEAALACLCSGGDVLTSSVRS
jgi:hypothetical protein